MTRLCAAIFVDDPATARRDIALAAEAGADTVELRIDRFTDPEQVTRLVESSSLPVILTCRPTWEGGECELPEPDRLALLSGPAAEHAAYVDLEFQAYANVTAAQAAAFARPLILSSHDFHGRPERLAATLLEMNERPARVTKIVWTARTVRDCLEAFEILQHRTRPTIALCMGEAGLISRVLAKKFGAFLTFASLRENSATAPGQVSLEKMKNLYRWDSIGPKTRVYGVVAQPVAHSMSPAIHNAAFDRIGHDGVYLPFLVNAGYESFKAFMETFVAFEPLHLSGLSITIPHKENALRYLQEIGASIDPRAAEIGAVNTIAIDRSTGTPCLRGSNTDADAILDSLTARLGISREGLVGRRVAVIGAGGSGRTAVAALAGCGASVFVANRTHDRAANLAAQFNGRGGTVVAVPIESLHECNCEMFLNATSMGMHPNVGESPLDGTGVRLDSESLVFDFVYNPMKTRLLEQAEAAGAKTINGGEMFVRQAAAQFQAWTGVTAPMDVMRRVVESRLSAAQR